MGVIALSSDYYFGSIPGDIESVILNVLSISAQADWVAWADYDGLAS
jgi:hypothetical protein